MTNVKKNAEWQNSQPTVIIQSQAVESNWVWTGWFVLALIWLFFSRVPFLWWGIWGLWLILSFAWLFKKPRWLAIAWFIISLVDLIILIAIWSIIWSIIWGL